MKDYKEIIKSLTAPNVKESFESLKKFKAKDCLTNTFKISKDIIPYDLYLYLYSRFSAPNGILSLIRNEDSDQLFHWHYSLHYDDENIQIMCATYRIEIFAPKSLISNDEECKNFLKQLIKDLPNYQDEVVKTRRTIENWEMLVNPFARIHKQINILISEVETLKSKIPDLQYSHTDDEKLNSAEFSDWIQVTEEMAAKSFSIQCLVPVYIETFVNFVIQVLAKKELKDNEELFDNFVREHIDTRIKSLHEKCTGFVSSLDWDDDICKKIHTIFNKRNDLLHGNFNMKKLKYGDVGFVKNMPLFKKLTSFKEDILNLELSNGNLDFVLQEVDDAQVFMQYVLISLEAPIRIEFKAMLESYTLGWNKSTKRFGILFKNDLVDFSFNKVV